jgi:hypothetical protein
MDEHGTTDADRARVEYIRLSCKPAKGRRTAAEGKWLDSNWRRLVPGFANWLDSPAVARPDFSRERGMVTVYGWSTATRSEPPFEPSDWITVELAFGRGFASRVRYEDADVFAAVGPRLAADEPLARHIAAVGREDPVMSFYATPDDGARKALIARAHAAIASALTAEARYRAGWPEDFPVLGR